MFLANKKLTPLFAPTSSERDPRLRMQQKLEETARASSQLINERLERLDREWDITRGIVAILGSSVVLGLLLSALLNPWWQLLSAVAGLSLMLLSVSGWCPLVPILRHLGFRTPQEIAQERYALKALRGDFQPLAGIQTPEDREAIARLEGEGGPASDHNIPDAGDPHIVRAALDAVHK